MRTLSILTLIVFSCSSNTGSDNYEEYYSNGQLEFAVQIKNGMKNGPGKRYFENGNIHYEANFVNDTIDGPYVEYFESGNIKSRTFFEMGKREGEVTDYFENGHLEGYRFLKNDTAKYLKKYLPDGQFDWFLIDIKAVKFNQDDGIRYWFQYPYSSIDSVMLLAIVTSFGEDNIKDTIFLKIDNGLTIDLAMPNDIVSDYKNDSIVFEICELQPDSSMTNVVALVPENEIETDTLNFVTRTEPEK